MKIYVTQMISSNKFSVDNYIVGAFTSESKAIYEGEVEQLYRGQKYTYKIIELNVDASDEKHEKYNLYAVSEFIGGELKKNWY